MTQRNAAESHAHGSSVSLDQDSLSPQRNAELSQSRHRERIRSKSGGVEHHRLSRQGVMPVILSGEHNSGSTTRSTLLKRRKLKDLKPIKTAKGLLTSGNGECPTAASSACIRAVILLLARAVLF